MPVQKSCKILLKYYGSLALIFLFFTLLRKIISPFDEALLQCGIFAQLFLLSILIFIICKGFDKFTALFPENLNRNWAVMLKIYAIVCLITAFISVNSLSFAIFALAE